MKIVFFDGYCSLCNSTVDWLIARDHRRTLKYASLQGETAARELGVTPSNVDPDTLIYLRDGARFDRSTAALKILGDVGGIWTLASVFLVVPRPIRDSVYRWIARNRFRWFGRRDTCRLPTPEERELLLP